MIACKRPDCDAEEASYRGPTVRDGYCSYFCDEIHSRQQDAQALYDALREWVRPENLHLQIPPLNHTYH